MDIRNPRALKEQAAERLSTQAYPPRRLALIHTAAATLALLAVTALNYLLSKQVGATSGLSGMGLRSVLQTAQMVLQYAINIILPFWQFGFLFAALRMARSQPAQPRNLTEGFRRFGPALRLMLLRGLVYGILAFVCMYASTMIFLVTPFARPMLELLMPIAESGQTYEQMQQAMAQLPIESVYQVMTPVLVIWAVIYLLLAAPIYYSFRLSDLIIMDKPGTGALAALALSSRLSRKKRFALLRLDLSFWWYYALQIAATLLCYLDVILSYVVTELPIGADTAYFVSYILGLGAKAALFTFAGSRLHATWAVAYDTLAQQPEGIPQPKPATKDLPWDNYNA